jgi:hypothetical protein
MTRPPWESDESFVDLAEPMYCVEFLNEGWEEIKDMTERNCSMFDVKSMVADWLHAHELASRPGMPKDDPLATAIGIIVEAVYDA